MSYTHNPESPWLFSRLFNPWRCSSNENSRLLATEVIEKFFQVEVKKNLRIRKRKPEDHKRFLKAIEAIMFCFRWNWKNLYHELVTF